MAERAKRPYEHAKKARRAKKHSYLYHWIRLLQSEGREPSVLVLEELSEDTTRKFLGFVEKCYIKSLREIGHRLVNVAEGGEGGNTGPHTPETIAIIRATHLGRKKTPEECAAISVRTTGNRSKRGQKDSAETRARKSAALKGRFLGPRKPPKPEPTIEEIAERKRLASACNTARQLGHVVTDKTREKLRIANLGRKASDEARANMAAAQIRRNANKRSARTSDTDTTSLFTSTDSE